MSKTDNIDRETLKKWLNKEIEKQNERRESISFKIPLAMFFRKYGEALGMKVAYSNVLLWIKRKNTKV